MIESDLTISQVKKNNKIKEQIISFIVDSIYNSIEDRYFSQTTEDIQPFLIIENDVLNIYKTELEKTIKKIKEG